MPTKTTKKTATKPVAKKAPAKKPVKKTVKPAPITSSQPVVADIPAPTHCCGCTKRKKFIHLLCAFILGILVAQLFCFCGCDHHKRAPRVHFVNGCVDVTTVKCPKMLEQLPNMDKNGDGCITRTELRAAKRAMRHHEKMAEPSVNVEDAIAPVME